MSSAAVGRLNPYLCNGWPPRFLAPRDSGDHDFQPLGAGANRSAPGDGQRMKVLAIRMR